MCHKDTKRDMDFKSINYHFCTISYWMADFWLLMPLFFRVDATAMVTGRTSISFVSLYRDIRNCSEWSILPNFIVSSEVLGSMCFKQSTCWIIKQLLRPLHPIRRDCIWQFLWLNAWRDSLKANDVHLIWIIIAPHPFLTLTFECGHLEQL